MSYKCNTPKDIHFVRDIHFSMSQVLFTSFCKIQYITQVKESDLNSFLSAFEQIVFLCLVELPKFQHWTEGRDMGCLWQKPTQLIM